jgi:hypothetical protein
VSAAMPGNPLTDPNWAPDLADQIANFIGNIRQKTTDNAIKVARALVFGLLGAILGIVALVLLIVGGTRGLKELYDLGTSTDQAVYLSYFTLGGIFTLVGVFLMTKRHPT